MDKEKYITMDIDSLATKCPYFTSLTDANNGYGCNHPEQEEFEELYKEDGYTYRGFKNDESKPKTRQGKCYSFSCPIAFKCTTIEELQEYDPDTADVIIRNHPNADEIELDLIADTYDIMVVEMELINKWKGGITMKEIQETHQKKGVVSSDEYYTPLHIIEALGHFDLDPATPPNPRWRTADVMYTKNDDGLSKEWFGRVFLNPPYSRPLVNQFMEKMAAHGNGIALVVPKLGTKMFREVVYPSCSAIYILNERIKFYDENWEQQKSPICQSMLVAFGEENKEAIRKSGLKGIMLVPETV